MKILCLLILSVCLLYSCEKDNEEGLAGVEVRIQVTTVAEGVETPMAEAEVTWRNEATGTVYRTVADEKGVATGRVETGIYRVTGSYRKVAEADNRDTIFSGSLERVSVDGNTIVGLSMRLEQAVLSRLVIKEIYYGGCRTDEGVGYDLDGYVSLYNNSSDTLWLDGICIGMVGPTGQMWDPSVWLRDDPELSAVPVFLTGWQFPGSGHDYPLVPGAETVVAVNAVDHTGGKYGHSLSVDLSRADWAFYRSDFNPEFSDITPGVKPLSLFWLNWSVAAKPVFGIGPLAPALILYRMEGDAGEYVTGHLKYQSGKPEKPRWQYLMIPREWVLDCVECMDNETSNRRLPAVLDKSVVWLSKGTWSGKAFHRKAATNAAGRVIYQDTNDSAKDFEEKGPSLRSLGSGALEGAK